MSIGNTRRKLGNAKAFPLVRDVHSVSNAGWKFKWLGPPARLRTAYAQWGTAGAGGTTITLVKKAGASTDAVTSGTAMTAALDLTTAADTPVTMTLSTTPANLIVNTNDWVGITGTTTSLGAATLTLEFDPVV